MLTFLQICKECFYQALEDEVHQTIMEHNLFTRGDVVAMGASGGKDSTVLAHIMTTLNQRHECVATNLTRLHCCSQAASDDSACRQPMAAPGSETCACNQRQCL